MINDRLFSIILSTFAEVHVTGFLKVEKKDKNNKIITLRHDLVNMAGEKVMANILPHSLASANKENS